MQNYTTKTIRETAVAMPLTTRVFEEFKVDFSCGGRSFFDACRFAGVAPEFVSEKINQALGNQTENFESPETRSAAELIDCILQTHHVFTKAEISRLTALMDKVSEKHGEHRFELFALQKSFSALYDNLKLHMRREETVLFPFIKHLEMSDANKLSSPRPPFQTVKNPVRVMTEEHDAASDELRKMREITKEYAVPEDACPSFQALYFGAIKFKA